jgi:dihydroorotate dehydrogenase (fumarate)
MINLKTEYLGIQLKNPIIVSSSGLTGSLSGIQKLADAGAGAVVLKSIFEEQINMEAGASSSNQSYPEANDYIYHYTREHSIDQYLKLIEDAGKKVDIPVFGSINCISPGEWISFAESIQQAGANAIELNVFYVPTSVNEKSTDYENLYYSILALVKRKLNIPVAVKLGQNFSHLPSFINSLHGRGADGVVLFNRFYAPDIDIDTLSLTASEVFSSPTDIRDSLRWVAIISALIPTLDVCASTGIHNGIAVIKQLLAGAKAVQVCSSLYKNGLTQLGSMLTDIEQWMDKNNFVEIKEFRGRLNYKNVPDPMVFERSQFMKYYSDHI